MTIVSYCFDFSNTVLEHTWGRGREVPSEQWSTTPNQKCKFECVLKRGFAPLSSIFEDIPSNVTTLLNKNLKKKVFLKLWIPTIETKACLNEEKVLLHVSLEWQISLSLQPSPQNQHEAAFLTSQEKAACNH